jgi:hypothetical protein
MPRERWKLVQATPGHPEVDTFGDTPASGQALSLLACLAEDPANGLAELSPGRYLARKDSREMWR